MCSIIGMIGNGPIREQLLAALRRMEYRGYDSAGVAVLEHEGIRLCRTVGPVEILSQKLPQFSGDTGIGHTRWATHGRPTEHNAHPHSNGTLALVHNGIIENFASLKQELREKGCVFQSETDTEVIVHLIQDMLNQGLPLIEAFRKALKKLEGSFALTLVHKDYPRTLLAARQGTSPLAIGRSATMLAAGSDALGFAGFLSEIHYLNDQTFALLNDQGIGLWNFENHEITPFFSPLTFRPEASEKNGYDHYMLKEIHEQPHVIHELIENFEALHNTAPHLRTNELVITACGTAFYAGAVGKFFFERIARIPVRLELASEFHYRLPPLQAGGNTLAISQSGETADTIRAVTYAHSCGHNIHAVVNVEESSLSRLSSRAFYTCTGPEIGVASTKAFTAQMMVLLALACANRAPGNGEDASITRKEQGKGQGQRYTEGEMPSVHEIHECVLKMRQALNVSSQINALASELSSCTTMLFLGRGISYPLALEGALKMKELSYIHAEGFAAGELKHGPIALVDTSVPVVVLAPKDETFEKTLSNLQEVAARGAQLIVFTDTLGQPYIDPTLVKNTVVLPHSHSLLSPFVFAVALQLFAYHVALIRKCDIDQPRNLAKSVTVE